MSQDLKEAALEYHAKPRPGKLSVEITKPTKTSRDLSLAYSPGVAEPVREIAKDPENAYKYTAKGNLVAVISDGSAILGLGNLGPLASKPVMEGKGVLFKRFAGIDVFDIEVNSESPQAFIETVERIADTFGGINLEDIKAPECFEIERALIEKCNVPIFHDDQHGTAIVTAAGMINALELQGKKIEEARVVCLGAGAAAIACMKILISCGIRSENIFMLDRKGVIHSGRDDLNQYKAMFANDTDKRTLDDAIDGADVFLGLSGPDLLTAEQLKKEEEQAKILEEQRRKEEKQATLDQILLNSYLSEEGLINARDAKIVAIDNIILASNNTLKNQEQRLMELRKSAANHERSGKSVPEAIHKQIKNTQNQIQRTHDYIAGKQAEQETNRKQYEKDIQR